VNPYRLTPQARSDLLEITDYILNNSGAERAASVVGVIREAIEKVAETPGIGHKREDLTDEDVRFWKVFKYYVVYRPETDPLEVITIISGWRDVQTELARRKKD
jgi:antitoxin ParD1/3/4/toxin ParE1/3/4